MEKIKRVNATTQVVDSIKRSIQNGTLKVGDKLPKEDDMAKALGVGRSSLREGIKILAAYGVVEARQGEGTFIIDNCAKNFFDFLGFFPSKQNMDYFMELRCVLETGNIITIHDKLTEEDFAVLEKLVSVFEYDDTIDAYVNADRDFHNKLISYSQNPMIIQVNSMIYDLRSDLLYRLFSHKQIVNDARIAHREILDALINKDLEKCIQATVSHITTTTTHIETLF